MIFKMHETLAKVDWISKIWPLALEDRNQDGSFSDDGRKTLDITSLKYLTQALECS